MPIDMVIRYILLSKCILSNVDPLIYSIELHNGFGRHIFIYSPDEQIIKASAWLRGLWVFELVFHTATTISKFAMLVSLSQNRANISKHFTNVNNHSLAFYYRIFAVPGFRRLLICVAGLCVVYMIAIDLSIIFQWSYDSASRTWLMLTYPVNQSIMPGTKSIQKSRDTASSKMTSSSAAARSMPV